MERFILLARFIAQLFLILAVIVAGAEALRILQGENGEWITVAQTIDFAFSRGTGNTDSAFLEIPVILTFFALSVVFFLVGKRKKRR